MIYIIIGRDVKTGNEWVQSKTLTDSLKAAEYCEFLNKQEYGAVVFRVDTVEPSERKSAARLYADKKVAEERAALKHKMNAAYDKAVPRQAGKTSAIADYNEMLISQAGGDGDNEHKDTDSMRTKDFKIDELFPQGTLTVAYTLTCSECACEVKNVLNPYLIKHTEWHNKLLP